jgi:NSS family neurotransmitter:Na+ symporter
MERWSSQLGFLLAATGAAVGLGNIWRFSAVLGQNGGGAYLVPYLCSFFGLALPLLVLEIVVGRRFRADVVTTFRRVTPAARVAGWFTVTVVVVIASYYLVITGWTLSYLSFTLRGTEPDFAAFTGTWWPTVAFVVTTLFSGWVLTAGVRDGIERLTGTLVPGVFVVLIGMALYATTLPGFGRALGFLFTPDAAALTDPLVWGAAIGQAFFSLSAGQGIMLTYGSYLDDDTAVASTALAIGVADVAVALLSGLVIFPVVFTVGLAPTLGTELAFRTLPQAFAQMAGGRVIGIAFFGVLVAAAITSAVSMLEVGVAALSARGIRRRRATAIVTGVALDLGTPATLSYSPVALTVAGERVLDVLDETVGTLGLPITGLLIALVFGWVYDLDSDLRAQLGPRITLSVLRYVLPPVLVVVIGLGLLSSVPTQWRVVPTLGDGVSALVTAGVAVVLVGVAALLARTIRKRWRRPKTDGN